MVVLAGANPDITIMDAVTPGHELPFALRTPLHVGAVALWVRDLDRCTAFYRDVIGLTVLDRDSGGARLGTGATTLVELVARHDLAPDDQRTAGLYHTAFLMPARADLGAWVLHVAARRTPITGASDHGVSEAVYLDDPEGNGVEVYADRAPETWRWTDGLVAMPSKPLDVEDLLAEPGVRDTAFAAAPEGLRIGHVHLRVGDLDRAEEFYHGALGLDVTRRRNGAAFLSSGRYHHHVGTNVWHSAGATRRDARAGLAWFSIAADGESSFTATLARLTAASAVLRDGPEGPETEDPWGTRIRLRRGRPEPHTTGAV